MFARYATSAGAAGITTVGLLLMMSQMIAKGRPVVSDAPRIEWVPFIVERLPPEPFEPIEPIPQPPLPAERPQLPRQRDTGVGGEGLTIGDPAPPTIDGPRRRDRTAPADGDLLPIVKVQPGYPPTAARRGLEGYVMVEFTVNTRGNVEDPYVVESSHDVFDRAALDAAARFRYRPRVVNGEPVRVSGVRNLIRFELGPGAQR